MKVCFYFLITIIFFIVNGEIVAKVDVLSDAKNKQKNVIIIMSDDMGFHDVSYRGSNEIPTYNIDSLAYHGIILDRYISFIIISDVLKEILSDLCEKCIAFKKIM